MAMRWCGSPTRCRDKRRRRSELALTHSSYNILRHQARIPFLTREAKLHGENTCQATAQSRGVACSARLRLAAAFAVAECLYSGVYIRESIAGSGLSRGASVVAPACNRSGADGDLSLARP